MPFPSTYMTLYNASSHAIKAVDSQLKIGGPATAQLLDVKQFHDLATCVLYLKPAYVRII